MFIPNQIAKHFRYKDDDQYGQASFRPAKTVECAVVHLSNASQKSSVRTDSSASRGNVEEVVADAKILFKVDIRVQDKIEIAGLKLQAIRQEKRYDARGRLDHYEVDFKVIV